MCGWYCAYVCGGSAAGGGGYRWVAGCVFMCVEGRGGGRAAHCLCSTSSVADVRAGGPAVSLGSVRGGLGFYGVQDSKTYRKTLSRWAACVHVFVCIGTWGGPPEGGGAHQVGGSITQLC